ncbi:MAG: hypothetical protein ABR573_09750, partial [Candidatus Dormibacteria bacterium]
MTEQLNASQTRGAVSTADPEAAFRSTDALGTDGVGKIEAHGIDVIPDEERHGKPASLFPFWFGSNLIFTYLL